MGGRRKASSRVVEIFDGVGPSAKLELELAPGTRSGYVGVNPSPGNSGHWQAWIYSNSKKRGLGTFESAQEAAIMRALAQRSGDVPDSPPVRRKRAIGALHPSLPCCTPCLFLTVCERVLVVVACSGLCRVKVLYDFPHHQRSRRPDER